MGKSLAMKELHAARRPERRIAETRDLSRGDARRHFRQFAEQAANRTGHEQDRAQTGPT
jgi:hypothetical protein